MVIGGYWWLWFAGVNKTGGFIEQRRANEIFEAKRLGLDRIKGSHHIFVKEGVDHHITLPHPKKDLAKGTLKEVLKSV